MGGFGYTFPDERRFGLDDRQYLSAIATLGGQALVRTLKGRKLCRVLVVDDEPLVLRFLDYALRQLGYDVLLASSGTRAIDLFRQHHSTISLVLLDVQMAPPDGPQTLVASSKSTRKSEHAL